MRLILVNIQLNLTLSPMKGEDPTRNAVCSKRHVCIELRLLDFSKISKTISLGIVQGASLPPTSLAPWQRRGLTIIKWGGGCQICPPRIQKGYISGTKYKIDLKPGCKYKFFYFLAVYVKKITNLGHGMTLEGIFSQRVPKNQPHRVHLGIHLGVHEGLGGFP